MAANNNNKASYVLGIDLGTTTVKVALVDSETQEVIQTKSRETQASILKEAGSLASEQDPDKILTALQFCVSGLPKEHLRRIVRMGVSGQMHGVLLWKSGNGWTKNSLGRFGVGETSTLYTWQDGRCTLDFIASLPQPSSHLRLATGHGCVTIFWLKQNQPELLERFDCSGTIQDFVVAMLCGLAKPIMSVHNAASWGYYDTVNKTWNTDRLQSHDFPVHLLPRVESPGYVAGHTQAVWYGIPAGIPVSVAMGDLQCSIFSRLKSEEEAVLNISTSAQLAFQMQESFVPPLADATSTIEYFPYFNNRYLAVAASLAGGNVMAAFVKMLQQWTHELGLGVPSDKIWDRIHLLGLECPDTDLVITPSLYGERHNPSQRACVQNITPLNISLGCVYAALCRGLIANLHSMMSQDFLLAAGVQRIVGSGTAIVKNQIMRREIEAQYKLPLVLCDGSQADSAVGAALAVLHFAWSCCST